MGPAFNEPPTVGGGVHESVELATAHCFFALREWVEMWEESRSTFWTLICHVLICFGRLHSVEYGRAKKLKYVKVK